jgi:hypothetical protein
MSSNNGGPEYSCSVVAAVGVVAVGSEGEHDGRDKINATITARRGKPRRDNRLRGKRWPCIQSPGLGEFEISYKFRQIWGISPWKRLLYDDQIEGGERNGKTKHSMKSTEFQTHRSAFHIPS